MYVHIAHLAVNLFAQALFSNNVGRDLNVLTRVDINPIDKLLPCSFATMTSLINALYNTAGTFKCFSVCSPVN